MEVPEPRDQPQAGERRRCAHHQGLRGTRWRQHLQALLDIEQGAVHVRVKALAVGAQAHVLAGASEQAHAKEGFKAFDLVGDRRRADVQFLGRRLEAAQPCSGLEAAQGGEGSLANMGG